MSWLGPVAAACGYALFFKVLVSLSIKRRALMGFLWFSSVQAVQLFWMTSLEFQGPSIWVIYLVLAALLGLQCLLFSCILTDRLSWKRVLCGACLWVFVEWTRLFLFCGFSLNGIGQALNCSELSIQLASVIGALGLSFWVMLTNLMALKAWVQRGRHLVVIWGALALFPYVLGWWQTRFEERGEKQLRVALLQTDWLPCQKSVWLDRLDSFIPPLDQWKEVLRHLAPLKHQLVDLVVCPEAMVAMPADQCIYPFSLVKSLCESLQGFDSAHHFPPFNEPYARWRMEEGEASIYVSNLFLLKTVSNYLNATVIAGLDHTQWKENKHFNAAFYVRPDSLQIERYDKQILLPLAEYLPFSFLFDWIKRYGFHTFFTPGKSHQLWKVQGELVTPCICYEETFPSFMYKAKRLGSKLFVNMTNDNYYPHSILSRQHLFHARLRAVENGVPLVRACNGGGSAVIDQLGRIVCQLDAGEVGVLTFSLMLSSYQTLFSFYGESVVVLVIFLLIVCVFVSQSIATMGLVLRFKNLS